jgi:glycolate oxidase iron-sulfur subunit
MSEGMNLLKDMDYSVVQQCMHCGMCLPTCPTYVETKKEKNSPRGRIALMRSIADGSTEVTAAFGEEMYYCLGCLACETACPAGVQYAELFETARAEVERAEVLPKGQRTFWRWLALEVIFMRPRLLRAVGVLLRFYQQSGLEALMRRVRFFGLLPRNLATLESQTPKMSAAVSDEIIEEVESPAVAPRYRVGLLTGCIQDIAFSEVNRATTDVLLANGCEVITPRAQSCCGSLHAHNGAVEHAQELARRQLAAFDLDSLDAIITNAGGCGSHLKNYSHLLPDDPLAVQWDAKVKDVHEWLSSIGVRKPSAGCGVERVTYHESCHLCHGQKITKPPRELLKAIPGLEVVELPESNWCCGSAGIYNITQPEQSEKLLNRKVGHIRSTGCNTVATSNPGCHLQIHRGLGEAGQVTQPVVLLAEAYRREQETGCRSVNINPAET